MGRRHHHLTTSIATSMRRLGMQCSAASVPAIIEIDAGVALKKHLDLLLKIVLIHGGERQVARAEG